MRYITGLMLLLLFATGIHAQQQPDKKSIRIVDTLTAQERNNRNPLLLRSELDSIIKQYNLAHVQQTPVKEPEKIVQSEIPLYLPAALIAVLVLLAWLLYAFYRNRQQFEHRVEELKRQMDYSELYSSSSQNSPDMAKAKSPRAKTTGTALENKISDLTAELHKLSKENEGLNRVLKEYNGIQHEFDSLKHGISRSYKIRNYPGYDKTKGDSSVLETVLETEHAVAHYAYEKFLKPILALADANKNNPARISPEDNQRLLDLLISLSFLYIEYLYLRVNDLSIGGKMVERIGGLKKGNAPDIGSLKKLNTDYGSRALVLRMVLDKAALQRISYPVFDETDLNNH